MEWNYLVIVFSGIIALLLVLLEVRRKARRNLIWRLLASILAVAALTLIALPPGYKQKNKPNGGRETVLLTEGFSKDSLSAFSDPIVISTDQMLLENSGAKNKIQIPSIDYYLSENPGIKSIHILGTGLPNEELDMLKNTAVQFHEAGKGSGFQKVNWQQKIKSGEELQISGTYNNTTGRELKIQLKGLSTNLDSAMISADSLSAFKLSCIPRQLGTAINYLIVTSGKDTLSTEKVPFEVEQVKPLSIFILSSSPNFEVNFLKTWLADNRFSVAVRSKISKGKFSTEFLNMEAIPLDLQSGSLKNFDVLIADESSIIQLGQSERLAVNKQVNNGMGLIIRNEEEVKIPGFFGTSFPAIPVADQENLTFNIPGNKIPVVIPGRGANYLTPQAYDQPLIRDNKNRIIVNSMISGLGRIIFSTLDNTYFLKLSGKPVEYGSFWAFLIEKAARKTESNDRIKTASRFAVVHQKVRVMLQTESSEIPKLFTGGSGIHPEQDAQLPNRWIGSFWPRREGWNRLESGKGTVSRVFVFNTTDWLSVRKFQNLRATRQFAKQSTKHPAEAGNDTKESSRQIPPIFFYLLLLACCSYLWIETKFL